MIILSGKGDVISDEKITQKRAKREANLDIANFNLTERGRDRERARERERETERQRDRETERKRKRE